MEKLAGPRGNTRYIGISNFSPKQVEDLLKVATIKPKVHQIELHPYLQQDDFVLSLQEKGIAVTAYAPLGNTNPVYGSIGRKAPKILSNSAINEIARSRDCTPAQVVLSWNMAHGVAVIPKAAKSAHQKENIVAAEKCKLQTEDMAKIKTVATKLRVNYFPCMALGNACFEGLPGIQ
jgi:alcohol dehydrogenase (NADP+)